MFQPASILARIDISVSSSDEEIMRFLGGRKAGDPVPTNFITEVNPFSLEPWDAPEGVWYLYNSEDEWSCNQLIILNATQIGYWRFMDRCTIFRDNVIYGKKIIWEFYSGQEPNGIRTGWMMYDYHKFQKACEGINTAQNWSSMCRIFLLDNHREKLTDQKFPEKENFSSFSSNDVDGEHLESMLISLEQEERNCPTDVANQFEVGVHDARSNRSCQELLINNSTGDLQAFVEFSKGEYIELKDLSDLESTSFSSDDSTLDSSNFNECFDAEALLRDLEYESSKNIPEEASNIRPPQTPGSNKIEEPMHSNVCSPKNSIPVQQSDQRFSASTSSSCIRGHPKRTHSSCSESSSSSTGSGSKSVARISKLGKKYCCFAPF